MTLFGLDRFLADAKLRRPLEGKRIALLANPASVTHDLTHGQDAIAALADIRLTAAFGPQHGSKGDKQDNMVESENYIDPRLGIPVFSLYGETRRLNASMLDSFDVLLVDLQDLGCRIYTFLTTLCYVLEDCAARKKSVWVLDRPNPVGRPIEGLKLKEGWESFVGIGQIPMRHGLTLGEMAQWFIKQRKLDVDCQVITMTDWQTDDSPGFGWPLLERAWVNPSPNAANLSMARIYAGSVLLEGTTLSEGRGTTRPLELFGAPDIDACLIRTEMEKLAPHWLQGCRLREIWFEPTFHKHGGKLCHGIQFHVEHPHYEHHSFRPWRLMALVFKAIRRLYPDYPLWRDFAYEYEFERLAIDLINGSPLLRLWVDDPAAEAGDLETIAAKDEKEWEVEREGFLLYS